MTFYVGDSQLRDGDTLRGDAATGGGGSLPQISTTTGPSANSLYDAADVCGVANGISGTVKLRQTDPTYEWFGHVVDHYGLHPSDRALFIVERNKNTGAVRLVWERGRTGAQWGDVEALALVDDAGSWFFHIWDNGPNDVYVVPVPTLTPGQALSSSSTLGIDRTIDCDTNNGSNIVGNDEVEAMAWSEPEDAMYWFGPRIESFAPGAADNDDPRDVYRIDNWSTRTGAVPTADFVGPIVFRPAGSSPVPNASGDADISPDGNVIVIVGWSGGHHYAMFHVKAEGQTWDDRLAVKSQPDFADSFDVSRPNENIAFDPDMSAVYVAQEGNPGSAYAELFKYDLIYIPAATDATIDLESVFVDVDSLALSIDAPPVVDLNIAPSYVDAQALPLTLVAADLPPVFAQVIVGPIGGARVALDIIPQTLDIEDRVEERTPASFSVFDPNGLYDFTKGEPIEILNPAGDRVFSGLVEDSAFEVPEITPTPLPSLRIHRVEATDPHQITDRIIVAEAYPQQQLRDIVLDIAATYLAPEGITVAEVSFTGLTQAVAFPYLPATNVLDQLAELAALTIPDLPIAFTWWIDDDWALHFVRYDSQVAPFSLDENTMLIDGNPVMIGPPKLASRNPSYRNVEIIRGARDLTDSQVERFRGDDEARTFVVGFPIAVEPLVEVNRGAGYVAETISIRTSGTGATAWAWSPESPEVTQDSGEVALSSSDKVRVTYVGLADIIVRVSHDEEIARRLAIEGSGTGRVVKVDERSGYTGRAAVFAAAAALLKKFARDGRRLTFESLVPGLKAGQLLTVNLPSYGLVDAEFLITAVGISDLGSIGSTFLYRVEAVQGPIEGSWIRYFERITFDPSRVNLSGTSEQTTVLKLIGPFNDSYDITEALVVTKVSCPVPSATLYPLATLYPC